MRDYETRRCAVEHLEPSRIRPRAPLTIAGQPDLHQRHTGSIIQADFTGLALAAPAMGDYHLTAGSSAIDAMGLGATIDHGVDGDSRPSGAGYDVGADELH